MENRNYLFGIGASIILICLIDITPCEGLNIISRKDWGGRPPTEEIKIPEKLTYTIIHHSALPAACYTPNDCKKAMRSMQDHHQLVNKWSDIGYSFAIGGDGNIYEGRGFQIQGAHAPGYNSNSIGICLIGNWSDRTPPSIMITAAKKLIEYGVDKGYMVSNYKLHGHRQVKQTECPGDALFNEIKKWKNFSEKV